MGLHTLYLDDSKWGGSKNDPKCMVWGGLVVEESKEEALIEKLPKLKEEFKLNHSDPIKFNPPKNYGQKKISDQNEFRNKVLELIASSKVTLISAYYDKTKDKSFTKMAYQLINDLSIRFQFYMQEGGKSKKDRGSIVLAFPSKEEASIFSDEYDKIRNKGTASLNSKNWSTPSQTPVVLTSLENSLYFAVEKHHSLLQLADYVAGSVASAIKGKDDKCFYKLKTKFRNKNGSIKGIGLISYPHYTTEIDRICLS